MADQGSSAFSAFARALTAAQGWHEVTAEDFIEARDKSKRLHFLSPLTPADLAGHTMVLNGDGSAGVAVSGFDEVVNLFNNSTVHGEGTEALAEAIDLGARILECYDGYLPAYYRQMGFHETGRISFDRTLAHEWSEGMGEPDIVFMAFEGYSPNKAEAIARAEGTPILWTRGDASLVRYASSEWDDARDAAREQALP